MKAFGQLLALALLLALRGANVAALQAASSRGQKSSVRARAPETPVAKVVALLKDMVKQLEKDAQADDDSYNRLACWCASNHKEKSDSIESMTARIDELTHSIQELTAGSAQLGAEVKALEKEVQKNRLALDEAVAIYQKQSAESNSEEKDLIQSVSALKAALVVLDRNKGVSLLQRPRHHRQTVGRTMRRAMRKHASMLKGVFTLAEERAVESLVQSGSESPATGEISGILKQMLETFEANLAKSQQQSSENQKSYNAVKAAKESEIAAGRNQLDTKNQELALAEQKLAQAKQDIKDSRATRGADEQFLLGLKETCQGADREFAERKKLRSHELEAVSQALSLLTGDDARDLLSRTLSFLQEEQSSNSRSSVRQKASHLLSRAAARLRSTPLAAMAVRVRLDSFTKIKQGIDAMIKQLAKEKADEVKQKDFCVKELNENTKQSERKGREKADFAAKVEDLQSAVERSTEAINALKAEISEMQLQLKRAGANREAENKEFQRTVADQRETQKLLEAALSVLADFYSKGGKKAALTQHASAVSKGENAVADAQADLDSDDSDGDDGGEDDGDDGEDAPVGTQAAGFLQLQKSTGPGDQVMALLQQIITDAKKVEAQTTRSEQDSQKAYEDFVKESNVAIDAKAKDITNKAQNKAAFEADLVAAKNAHDASIAELEKLDAVKAQLHQSCDFILKNFNLRQKARDEEMEALRDAKATLSGAKLG